MAHTVLQGSVVRVERNFSTRIGDQVRFRAGNVFLWPEEDTLSMLPEDAEIEGRVVGFSDSGLEPLFFAVIEVVRKQTIIVPVSGLKVIENGN
jgi:hypothetical protein